MSLEADRDRLGAGRWFWRALGEPHLRRCYRAGRGAKVAAQDRAGPIPAAGSAETSCSAGPA